MSVCDRIMWPDIFLQVIDIRLGVPCLVETYAFSTKFVEKSHTWYHWRQIYKRNIEDESSACKATFNVQKKNCEFNTPRIRRIL